MAEAKVVKDIQAPAAEVWAQLADFGGIKAGGPIESVSVEGEGVGMVRTLVMGGASVVERLEEHDAERLTFTYAIINEDSPLPFDNYSATVNLTDNPPPWTGRAPSTPAATKPRPSTRLRASTPAPSRARRSPSASPEQAPQEALIPVMRVSVSGMNSLMVISPKPAAAK